MNVQRRKSTAQSSLILFFFLWCLELASAKTGKNQVQQESTPSVEGDGNLGASSSTSNIHTVPHIQQQQRIAPQSPTKNILRRKVKILQQRIRRRKDKKIKNMCDIISILKKKMNAPDRLLERLKNNFSGLCEVESGQSNIILDIEESRGSQISQGTTPAEIPVVGDPFTDIALDLVFPKGNPVFILNGKKLQLLAPLDRDQESVSHIVFQLTCTVKSSNKKRTYPVIVRVTDINDNAPIFVNTPYETTISELTPVGSTIFRGLKATDNDAGVNGLVEYTIVPGDGRGLGMGQGVGRERVNVADGYGYFSINLPHQGQVTVNKSLDYERTQRYLVTVVASDRARNQSDRLSATTTLTVNVKDYDDQDPSFIYQNCMVLDGGCVNPEYHAVVSSGVLSGILSVSPEKIQAVDMDTLNNAITYSFLSGTPASYKDYFEINPNTGIVRQTKAVDTSIAKKFEIIVKAEEVSENHRFTSAKLFITVKPVDSNPPQITASATEGYVDENAPKGTKVLDQSKNPITLTVTDADLGPEDGKPTYLYELTTSFFAIDDDGTLVVAEDNLDRDPPSPGKFRFQIIAREKTGTAASTPLTLTVILNDVNDNAPRLPMIPPISVQAGEGHREIVQVVATDNDLGQNAEITYSIYHVSNNGRNKFKIDPASGTIETTGKLNAGEQYSITVQATDSGGKSSQTIVEVTVVPGPNTRSPVFQQSVYHVTISEGAPINSTVVTVVATDPENDPVSYSIVSGNDLRQFAIDDKTGVISVIRKLDREDLTRYQLVIRAEDEGGLSNTATVNIVVSDINDKNPEFVGLPYEFVVREGEAGSLVGTVRAVDADEGTNALVTYSLPSDVPFAINSTSGIITTSNKLDYETQKEYRFVVTARDSASEPRIATASVLVRVSDIEDELPIFHQTTYEATVPENVKDYVVTTVKADDADTKKRVTYVIKQGPMELFSIDPQTGVIKTLQGLDYESENEHMLIVGTVENTGIKAGATATVLVHVQDKNDIAPVFLSEPRPITIDDNTSIGTKLVTLAASDADGTAPGNKVRYEITGRGKSARYFQIDPESGDLQVRDDLRKEPDNEYQIVVKAYDLGEPQLFTDMTVSVFVRHTTTVAPEVGPGFADDSYTVEVPENAPVDSLVKVFTIIHADKTGAQDTSIKCTISSGNEQGAFTAKINKDKNCELRLAKSLDREKEEYYHLQLDLEVNPQGSGTHTSAMVKIQVLDVNDNIPEFLYPETNLKYGKEKYYGAIGRDKKEVGASVIQVKAEDKDAGKFGRVEYRLVNNGTDDGGGMYDYFCIDANSGDIRTQKPLDTVPVGVLPIRLTVEARDNPQETQNFNIARTEVVINLIEDIDRLILVINDKPAGEVQADEQKIVATLEAQMPYIVGVEKISARHYTKDNASISIDQSGTDLWFYAIDPETELIVGRNDSRIQHFIQKAEGLSEALQASVSSVHGPISVILVRTAVAHYEWEVFPYAMIVIAALIFVLGIAGIAYICISWSRYKAYKERMQRMYVMPRYDPVFVEPNLKEYETQVLQMSVPMDDNDSYNDLQLDFSRKNHAFDLDNVGYITKESGGSVGQQSPVSSEAATTTRASSLGRREHTNNSHHHHHHHHHRGSGIHTISRSDNLHGGRNSSSINDNVTFREKKDYSHLGFNYLADRSPVETTTEL